MTGFLWFLPWLFMDQGLPDLPKPQSNLEAYLVIAISLLGTAVVAMFIWINRIHAGHKKGIRDQDEAHRKECNACRERATTERDEVIRRLIDIAEKATKATTENTGAINTLASKL